MRNFSDYVMNENYTKAYGFDGKGLVYIENERDSCFWESIFDSVFPGKYTVKSSIHPSSISRGKRKLEKFYSHANEFALIAIDSDFDYPCQDRNDYSKHINSKYILHTHSYSRESVICNPAAINETIKRIRFSKKSNFDISIFLERYSEICFYSLPPFLFLLNNRFPNIREKDFHDDLNIREKKGNPMIIDGDTFNFSLLEDNKSRVLERKLKYEKIIKENGLDDEYANFLVSLENLGITKKTAYRYISGHVLYKSVIIRIIKGIKSRLMKAEIDKAKSDAANAGKSEISLVNGIENHFSTKCSIESILDNSEKILSDEIYLKILDKVRKVTTP